MLEVTVIIPVSRHGIFPRPLLHSLRVQTHAASEFEVIVVVDGPVDIQNVAIVEDSMPYPLHVVSKQEVGLAAARNQGAQLALGRYCLFLGDDVIASPNLVVEHLKAQREREHLIGIGRVNVTVTSTANGFSRWLAAEHKDRAATLCVSQETLTSMDCSTDNLCVARDSFLSAGGFINDLPNLAVFELTLRLLDQGCHLEYVAGAAVHKRVRKSFDQIAAEIEAIGEESVKLYARRPDVLPRLQLGTYHDTSLRGVMLRRILLRARVPVRLLCPVGVAFGSRPWQKDWYRFLYAYCYWRGVRRAVSNFDTWRRLTQSVPILMYHAFTPNAECASRYIMPADRFNQQMVWLRRLRFNVMSLDDYLQRHRQCRLSPARSVVITIDDGYADNREIAFPILRRHGFPAIIFVVTGVVGGTNAWDRDGELSGRSLLSWNDVRDMAAGGIQFGAHTRSHVSLSRVPASEAEEEILASRSVLERELGMPVQAFSYPNGAQNALARLLVQSAGFAGACCSWTGLNPPSAPLFALRRVEIRGTDSLPRFLLALLTGRTRLPKRKHASDRATTNFL